MKRLFSILFFCALPLFGAEVLRVDASSEEKMQQSFFKVLMSLDDVQQQKFSSAMAIIGLVSQEEREKYGDLQKLLNGKTADEIIALARRMTPHIKQHSKLIDGSSGEAFGKSVNYVLISLPEERQGMFSEALAKLMYEAKKNKEDEVVFRKKLDGKTGDEIILLAQKIDLPFEINSSSPDKEYKVSPLTPEEREKMQLEAPKPEEEKDKKSYGESLVPKG